MSRAGLARIWQILGALLALYSIGTWIILQGGKSFAEIPGLEAKSPVTSAYLAIPIIGILLGILASIGLLHMRTTRNKHDELFPIVAIGDVGPHTMKSFSMTVYQGFFVLIFLLVPAAALYQLNAKILQRGVLWHDEDPALGSIVLKNAFWTTRGGDSLDATEYACSSQVLRSDGYTWLGNMRCDFVKNAEVGPFSKSKNGLMDNLQPTTKKTCVHGLATEQSQRQKCEGVRDLSEICENSERYCRGVQWLPIISPALLIIPTFFGWIMVAWLLISASLRKLSA